MKSLRLLHPALSPAPSPWSRPGTHCHLLTSPFGSRLQYRPVPGPCASALPASRTLPGSWSHAWAREAVGSPKKFSKIQGLLEPPGPARAYRAECVSAWDGARVPPLTGVSGALAGCPDPLPECDSVQFSRPVVKPARVPPAGTTSPSMGSAAGERVRVVGDLGSRPLPLGVCCSPTPCPSDPLSGIAPFPPRHPAFLLRSRAASRARGPHLPPGRKASH